MAQFAALDQHISSAIDDTANPPWCMVPAQGTKTVRLLQGDGLTLRVSGAGAAGIQFRESSGVDGRRIEIRAQGPGEASLQAMNGQTAAATLDISVFPRKEFKIAILFVYDRSGENTGRPLSRLGYAELQNAIGVVNNIYLPQANITARVVGMGPAHVQDDLSQGLVYSDKGVSKAELQTLPPTLSAFRLKTFPRVGCVSGTAPGPGTCDSSGLSAASNPDLRDRLHSVNENFNLFTRALPNADFSYLVINKLLNAPDVGAYTEAEGCILPDTVPAAARSFVMGHEFGHFLLGRLPNGGAWHTADKRDLMYPTLSWKASEFGFLIRKAEAIQMSKKTPK